MKNIFSNILLFSISFLLVISIFFVSYKFPLKKGKNNYKKIAYSLRDSSQNKTKKINIEIQIYDDTKKYYQDIKKVTFNNEELSLLPTNSNGYRGSQYFKLKKGQYNLSWVVTENKIKDKTIKKTITIKEIDNYYTIIIEGEDFYVTKS